MTPCDAIRCVGLVALLSPTLFATPVFVSNFSFETLPAPVVLHTGCGAGCSFTVASENAIPGWNASSPGTEGQFNPGVSSGNTSFYNSVPDGNWVAYSNGGNLTQAVSPVLANTTYMLSVSLGLRKDFPALGTAELVINGNTYVATGVAPTSGNWATFTATYNSGLHPADVGLPITIELLANGVQAGFDDVLLNANSNNAVPEPASLAFAGLGLVGLSFAVRRHARLRR